MNIKEFEDFIPEDAMRLTFKIDYQEHSEEELLKDDFWVNDQILPSIRAYMVDWAGTRVLAAGAGLHFKGKSEKPHVHYVFILKKGKTFSNFSTQSGQWLAREENRDYTLGYDRQVSHKIRVMDKDDTKFTVFSYVLKEGHSIPGTWQLHMPKRNPEMPKVLLDSIKEVGKIYYETQCALRLRQDKCEERKKNAAHELLDFCNANLDKFKDYDQMVDFLNETYLREKSFNDRPAWNEFQKNCRNVGFELKLYKYSG